MDKNFTQKEVIPNLDESHLSSVVVTSVSTSSLDIVSERAVPENIPFEKFSIGFYRSQVEVEAIRLSSFEYGVLLTFMGAKPKDNRLVARLHVELKVDVDSDSVKLHYLDRIEMGDYDKKLKQLLDAEIRQQKSMKRSKREAKPVAS